MSPPLASMPDTEATPAMPIEALAAPASRRHWTRPALAGVGLVAVGLVAGFGVQGEVASRAVLVAGVCLVLWLSELVPPFVPTLLLLGATPVVLGPLAPDYQLASVLRWCADPVLILFLGGFTLEVAAMRHGLDSAVARHVVRGSRGRPRLLLLLVMGGVAFLSMWMSNVAAAAMMLAALRPVLLAAPAGAPLRPALLATVALGANLGGMATPVGSGPNALAVSAASTFAPVTFAGWMAFALPLTALMLLLGFGLILLRFRVAGPVTLPAPMTRALSPSGRRVLAVSAACVAAWLTEPLHGVPAPVVALGATALLFGTGLLRREDLGRLDWSTLLLIAGGLALGKLLEHSGLVAHALDGARLEALPREARLGALVVVAAVLSALMSNTGTAALLLPLALSVEPSASTPILVAMGCAFGIPFAISTPPNAMAAGEGLDTSELLRLGVPLMVAGCLLVSVTGPWVLRLFGLP
ncbi:sodium:sulfate symporter [Myxococcus stipitatus DSM 14675]|uniref:Sodium:sulfate symporter n=1 Tax=Myxococcus stipitatus (strain DSM 14675 / JCM 12634 / Mx s8) TaxID=1278073 RepID=L7UEZ7_MYXSD|nr:SLC13 family permease [Myxococcus stipitatus]AGC45019.1 sodium:sulfate symporter [Myxococcus stipitatus DSM 14675]